MKVEVTPASQKMVMVEAPFIEELSGMAMVKILDMKTQTTNMVKLKIYQEQSNFEDYKQNVRNYYFWQNRYDGSCRFEIVRFLQNKARGPSRTFE